MHFIYLFVFLHTWALYCFIYIYVHIYFHNIYGYVYIMSISVSTCISIHYSSKLFNFLYLNFIFFLKFCYSNTWKWLERFFNKYGGYA